MRGRDCYDNRSFDFNLTSKNNPHSVLGELLKKKEQKRKTEKERKDEEKKRKGKEEKRRKKKKNKPCEFTM